MLEALVDKAIKDLADFVVVKPLDGVDHLRLHAGQNVRGSR
jgi:hypothetical protein